MLSVTGSISNIIILSVDWMNVWSKLLPYPFPLKAVLTAKCST